MATFNTTLASSIPSSAQASALSDEARANINAKPKPGDADGGMMTSADQSHARSTSPPSPSHHDLSPTSSSGSSGSSSSTPTPTAATAGGTTFPKRKSPPPPPPPGLRSSSPQHIRKSPDSGVRRNPSTGSGSASYSGLVAVPEEGVMNMDFSHSIQPSSSTSTSTATARNYGATFVVPDEPPRLRQSPPRYLGGLDLSGDDLYDSEDEDLEEWLIDEELAREGLYRGSYKRILTLYTLTPLTTLIAFGLLSLVPVYLRAYAFRPTPPEPIPPDFPSPSPGAPAHDNTTMPGNAYTPYLPYPLPELIGGMAVWSLGYLARQGLAFIGSLFSSDDEDDEEDVTTESRTLRGIEFGGAGDQTPPRRDPRRNFAFGVGKTRRTLQNILSISRNTIVGSITILLQSVLSIILQLVSIILLGVTLDPPLTPLPPQDPSLVPAGPRLSPYTLTFARIWYIALGWAAIEAILGIAQGYANLALYRDVVVSVRRVVSPGVGGADIGSPAGNTQTGLIGLIHTGGGKDVVAAAGEVNQGRSRSGTTASVDSLDSPISRFANERQPLLSKTAVLSGDETTSRAAHALPAIQIPGTKKQYTTGSSKAIEMEVEHDLEELVALKKREELEEMYGMPFIYIPSFISCLHRLNALLFTVGSFLLVGAGYLRLSTPIPPSIPTPPSILNLSTIYNLISSTTALSHTSPTVVTKTGPKVVLFFVLPTATTLLLSILHSPHSPRVLPWIGIHTYVFVSLMVSLGVFFAGLGCWGAVV